MNWREQGADLLPVLITRVPQDATVYSFLELIVREARAAGVARNAHKLGLLMDFTRWCLMAEDRDLVEASALMFYEPLLEHGQILSLALPLLTREEVQKMMPRWELVAQRSPRSARALVKLKKAVERIL